MSKVVNERTGINFKETRIISFQDYKDYKKEDRDDFSFLEPLINGIQDNLAKWVEDRVRMNQSLNT